MDLDKQYKYKFSIVVAIYNVEEYLEEAILSVINQTIGFEEYVQLILVNDGSVDNSKDICEKYKKLYPNNVVYVEKENGGVSSARNEGMKYIKGKYMNFLDGDDKLKEDALTKVYNFFENQYDYIDVVSIPILFFEGKTGRHILNYKYNKTRQINLLKEYKNIQLFTNSAFIKSEYKEMFNFTINMKYAEDAEFVNKVLLNKFTIGVLSTTNYWYRFRNNNSSAIQTGISRKEWYIEYLKTFSLSLINYAKSTIGNVPKFIQYTIMYDLQWRFKIQKLNSEVLNLDEQREFIELLKNILQEIDNSIIIEQKNLNLAEKKYILSLKNGHDIEKELDKIYSYNNLELMFDGNYLGSVHNEKLKIDFLEINKGILLLEGCITKSLLEEDYEIQIEFNDKIYVTDLKERNLYNLMSLGNTISKVYGFKVEIKVDNELKEQCLRIYLKTNKNRVRLKMALGKFVRINQNMKSSYFITESHRVIYKYNSFILLKNSIKVNCGREIRLLADLFKRKEFKVIAMRLAYFFIKRFKAKEIWLFMERIDKADDNAEHLFKYALKQNDNIKKYFVISKNCSDYGRIKKIGKVIAHNSMYHKFMLLLSDKMISSQGEDGIRVPFMGNGRNLRDLCDFKYIFLQHGIIKDNLSVWLNKYNKNLHMFVTSVNLEYQSILNDDYGYNEGVVKLTGLPRYDGLNNQSKKIILIMPTWRSNIVHELNQTTGLRPYNEKFKDSDYCKKYNNLINNPELLNLAKENGYKIVFFLHPCVQQQIKDFHINNQIIVPKYNESYQKMFNGSSLLITDYSSVAFDFAYMKKPVIYYQFDRATFFKGHTYTEGYFDYEKMGMGPVYCEENKLIDGVREHIENQCKIQDVYKKRIDAFYKYTDKDNCKRVYDEIRSLK